MLPYIVRLALLKIKIHVLNVLLNKHINFKYGNNVKIGRNVDIRLGRNCSLIIGDGCHIGDFSLIDLLECATIELGKNVILFKNVFLVARNKIQIGDDCLIAEFSSIRDFDHSFGDLNIPVIKQGYKSLPITIEEDVWIGRGVAVLKGVRIGRHSVIGANSVVTKNIQRGTVAAGVPAKVVRCLKNEFIGK